MKKDAEDGQKLLPIHTKELAFMDATLTALEGDWEQAKSMLRNCLKLNFEPVKQAQILNNLAYVSWKHLESLKNK